MTPLMTATSNHKYDTADYRNIDPHFGSNDDFSRLTAEAAKRGLRVIPDASLNHTGARFDLLRPLRQARRQRRVRQAAASTRPRPMPAGTASTPASRRRKAVQGLGRRASTCPNWTSHRRRSGSFAYGADDSVMKLWLDRGAAGWRMDVAPWVPDDFWREWRTAIKQHRPDALTVAETWFDSSKYFLGDMLRLDHELHLPQRRARLRQRRRRARGYRNLEYLREAYPPQSLHALMNLLSTHDVARSLHLFGYSAESDPPAQIALAKQRLRLALFFQMTYPGAPAIYYGDEVGVTGGEDPFNRATYPWADRGGQPDLQRCWPTYKRLLGDAPRSTAVLRRGSLSAPLHLDEHVIVLARQPGDALGDHREQQ